MILKNKIFLFAISVLSSACTTAAQDVFAGKELIKDNPNFTGNVWLGKYVSGNDSLDCSVSSVTFPAGVRNNWHSHPGGQILLCTSGEGRYQEKGKSVRVLRPGDVVKIAPDVVHWHGAAPDHEFTHIAIGTQLHKGNAHWYGKTLEAAVGSRSLVAYFSAEGHTEGVAKEIARLTGADIYKIEPATPYAANPYDDSDKIKDEAYNDRRPAVANLPASDFVANYDTIYVGTPCWWHQPAMVVCTFLEHYDLSGKVVVPFVTFGATTYLNETMQKLFRLTPRSQHIPAALPEDLDPDDITTPGAADDEGIDMPGNAGGTAAWLTRIGILSK